MEHENCLENKLMEFYTHYEALTNLIEIFNTATLNDETNEITREKLEFMLEQLHICTDGKLSELENIIELFQQTYCKEA